MSQPDQLPVDPGNQLLGETPAQLATALVDTPAGQRLALTIRTPSTTLTVLLGAADAAVWAGNVKTAAGQMSSTGLIVAAPGLNNHALAERP
jgi:hypothetical protein